LPLIQSSVEGISMAELKEKTSLKDRQIWNIITSAKKIGKIKQVKRGVYIGVAESPEQKTI
jgi:predicted transcriptional regulator of viral defense system